MNKKIKYPKIVSNFSLADMEKTWQASREFCGHCDKAGINVGLTEEQWKQYLVNGKFKDWAKKHFNK